MGKKGSRFPPYDHGFAAARLPFPLSSSNHAFSGRWNLPILQLWTHRLCRGSHRQFSVLRGQRHHPARARARIWYRQSAPRAQPYRRRRQNHPQSPRGGTLPNRSHARVDGQIPRRLRGTQLPRAARRTGRNRSYSGAGQYDPSPVGQRKRLPRRRRIRLF